MSLLLITTLCLLAVDDPPVTVTNPAEAAELKADTRHVIVEMDDHETLATVFRRVPKLRRLDLSHPGNKMPLESFKLLARFKNLESLKFEGDPFLSDEKFALIGQLHQLNSLSMSLP